MLIHQLQILYKIEKVLQIILPSAGQLAKKANRVNTVVNY